MSTEAIKQELNLNWEHESEKVILRGYNRTEKSKINQEIRGRSINHLYVYENLTHRELAKNNKKELLELLEKL